MPINHLSLPTGPCNFALMRDFYLATLQPLGFKIYKQVDGHFVGLQAPHAGPDFWLHCGGQDFEPVDPKLSADENLKTRGRSHVAFDVGSRKEVDEFYAAALKAGGVCNGAPGERSYAKGYYAAFVLDPLGNNIEAVHFNPLWLRAIKAAPSVVMLVLGIAVGHFGFGYFA